tara:strand:+ start:83 stop:301 length:219 start_codon:yes stop_codon:yes gene_type:complete
MNNFEGDQFHIRKANRAPTKIQAEESILKAAVINTTIKLEDKRPSIPSIKFEKLIIEVIKNARKRVKIISKK